MDQSQMVATLRERRRHERLGRNFPMRFGLLGDLAASVPDQPAELLDIGGGGLRFAAGMEPAKNAQLLIEVEIPGWQVIDGDWQPSEQPAAVGVLQVIGKVMWSAPKGRGGYEVGVRFIGQIR